MTGSAQGKLILTGEHAVLYGAPALGITLPWQMAAQISLVPASQKPESDLPPGLKDFEIWIKRNFSSVFPEEWRFHSITSAIPQGGGFGSSAALCVSTVRALISSDDPNEIWNLANRLERYFHGNPSGVDTALSLFGGIQLLQRSTSSSYPLERQSLEGAPLFLLTDWVPKASDTKESIRRLKEKIEEPGSPAGSLMTDLISLSEETCSFFCASPGNYRGFGQLLNKTHDLLNKLGLGCEEQNYWIEQGRRLGALAGKLSGSGKGGAYFLLCASEEQARAIAADFLKRWNRKLQVIISQKNLLRDTSSPVLHKD
jgi:mevalonate kinase